MARLRCAVVEGSGYFGRGWSNHPVLTTRSAFSRSVSSAWCFRLSRLPERRASVIRELQRSMPLGAIVLEWNDGFGHVPDAKHVRPWRSGPTVAVPHGSQTLSPLQRSHLDTADAQAIVDHQATVIHDGWTTCATLVITRNSPAREPRQGRHRRRSRRAQKSTSVSGEST